MQGRTLATSNICNPMTSWKKLSLRRITFGTEVGGVDLSLFTIFPNFLIATGALFVAMRHKRCRFWCSVTIITTIAIITIITIIAIITIITSITSYYHYYHYYHYYCCHCCCYYYSCTRLALFSPVPQMRTHLLGQHPFSHRYIYPGWKDNFCDCGK